MENLTCIRQHADIAQITKCKNLVEGVESNIESIAGSLSLMGNQVRLKLLFLLHAEKRLCVCDMSDILDMNVSAISQHLRKMKDRKLIYTEREGQTIYYYLSEEYEKLILPILKLINE